MIYNGKVNMKIEKPWIYQVQKQEKENLLKDEIEIKENLKRKISPPSFYTNSHIPLPIICVFL